MNRAARHHAHALERSHRIRCRVAQEAARLISESGIRDYHHAKLKAAARLGVEEGQHLPRNHEVEQALREHQRLFLADSQSQLVRRLREAACEAMTFLASFHPRLVGPVLNGTADQHSAVRLHLFSEPAEAVAVFLDDRSIPFEQSSRRLRLRRDLAQDVPVLKLQAEDTAFDLTILPLQARRQAPPGSDERPMPRASLAEVRALLHAEPVIAQRP